MADEHPIMRPKSLFGEPGDRVEMSRGKEREMTDTSDTDQEQKEWYREAEDALAKAGEALRGAWEASRDARLSALESAKAAAQQLGDAIEKGVAGAKARWSEPGAGPERAGSAGEEEE